MTKNVFLEIISWSISKSIGPNYIPSCTPIFFFKAVCSNQRDFLINFISLTKGWKSIAYLMYLVDGVTAVYYFSMSNFWGFVNIINVTMSNLNWNSLSLTNCSTNTKNFETNNHKIYRLSSISGILPPRFYFYLTVQWLVKSVGQFCETIAL